MATRRMLEGDNQDEGDEIETVRSVSQTLSTVPSGSFVDPFYSELVCWFGNAL